MTHIGPHPPAEMYGPGLELDVQCARCGSSMDSERVDCDDGWHECDGSYVVHSCLSSPEFCEMNPLPGRENVRRGEIEWFTVKERS